MKNSWSPRFGENNFLLSNNISVTEIAKAIIEAAMIHYVTKNQFWRKNKKTKNLAKHIEDLINYETLRKIAF